jgi:type II secretory ATPase GspE/PulE/Tfp pilus assembly ATPase PilB-like protein
VLYFNQVIRDLIRDGASPEQILVEARKNDLMIMREDGVLKAMKGETTLDELFKVID